MQKSTEYALTFIVIFAMMYLAPIIIYLNIARISLGDHEPLPPHIMVAAEEISARFSLPIPSGGIEVVRYDDSFWGAYTFRDDKILIHEDAINHGLFACVLIHELAHANDANYMVAGLIVHTPVAMFLSIFLTQSAIVSDQWKRYGKAFLFGGFGVTLFVLFLSFNIYTAGYNPLTILQEVRANYIVGTSIGHWTGLVENMHTILSIALAVAMSALATFFLRSALKIRRRALEYALARQHIAIGLSEGREEDLTALGRARF